MTSLSKEIAAEDNRRKKKQKVVGTSFKDLPEEVVLLVFSFVDFVTLCRVKPTVCKWWKDSIDRGIEARLGKKPFMLEDEQKEKDTDGLECNILLRVAVINYCFCKGYEIPLFCTYTPIKSKSEYAEELASMYGWPIGKWDVSQVTNFRYAFANMSGFNEDIGDWIVSKATTFDSMFFNASSFNQDLSSWNTANIRDMSQMFYGATLFNQDISSWNVTRVEGYECMFDGATSFNHEFSPHFESDE